MRSTVGYASPMRTKAKELNRPLFTVEVDRRHCTDLPDNERSSMSMQGPATPLTTYLVRQLLLRLSHVSEDDINELLGEKPEPAVATG